MLDHLCCCISLITIEDVNSGYLVTLGRGTGPRHEQCDI